MLSASGAAQVTVVTDREGDIYEDFACRPREVDVLIRAGQDRSLVDGSRLFAKAEALPEAGRMTVDLAAPRECPIICVSGAEGLGRRQALHSRHRARPIDLAPGRHHWPRCDPPAGRAARPRPQVDSPCSRRWRFGPRDPASSRRNTSLCAGPRLHRGVGASRAQAAAGRERVTRRSVRRRTLNCHRQPSPRRWQGACPTAPTARRS